jgi:peptide/nickel transport system substrate-binding protein
MRWTPILALAIAASTACTTEHRTAPPTAVLVVGEQASVPVPVLLSNTNRAADADVADLMFLRLAALGPDHQTAGDSGFEPQLARSWTRRDSVTLAFALDPHAQWQDGAPVTAHDVTYTFSLARDSSFAPTLAGLLRNVDSVYAEGDRTVVVHFRRVYAEQLYDAVQHAPPLPSHLLEKLPKAELIHSPFVAAPIGDGPYRWAGAQTNSIELRAADSFFLGNPAIRRVIIETAKDADARLNLLLTGHADALGWIVPPLANAERVSATKGLELVPVPSSSIGYLLFNARDPNDSARPHPILSDVRVRRAIVLALDRAAIVRSVLGAYGSVPYGPVSAPLWIARESPAPAPADTAEARRLLLTAGWRDSNGDGIADRNGKPLHLTINVPAPSATRRAMATLAQEQLRHVGIDAELLVLDGPVHGERRKHGQFDIDFSGALQDLTPSGLTQSWSCDGGSNVGHYCDAVVDSLMNRAITSSAAPDSIWQAALRRIEADAPAVFLYRQVAVYGLNRRFGHVDIRPESPWIRLWRWSVDSTVAPRDTAVRQ